MTTTVTPDRDASVPELQGRVSTNVSYRMWQQHTSGRKVATALGIASSGFSQRMTGAVMWDLRDLDRVAKVLHVPSWWLFLPEAEFQQKCTAPDLNRQPADSLHTAVAGLAAGSTPRRPGPSSPRVSTSRLPLVRPRFGAGAAAPRRAA